MPLILYSADGLLWTHGTKSPTEFENCTSQGCVLYDGAIVDLYGEKPLYTTFPADGTLTPNWAISKGRVCTVGSALRCADAKPSADLPPRPQFNRPITLGPGHNLSNPPPGCLVCPLNAFPLKRSYLGQIVMTMSQPGQQARQMMTPGLQATLRVRYRARRDGTVDRVQTKGSPRKEIDAPIDEDIRSWIFEPQRGSAAVENENREIKVIVSCMAFPSDDVATCTATNPSKKD